MTSLPTTSIPITPRPPLPEWERPNLGDSERCGVRGLWLPLITPFVDEEVDYPSLRRLIHHYAAQPIDGIILAATTGESLTLSDEEMRRIVETAKETMAAIFADRPRPAVYLGLSGSDTRKLVAIQRRAEDWPVDGYLITCPYFVRPSQDGLRAHFTRLAESTRRPILIYNIPYRTGINLSNAVMLELAGLPNIVGVKDCCADAQQSFDLMRQAPPGFSVMTGEDAYYYTALSLGGAGGILASAHIETELFSTVYRLLQNGGWRAALKIWQDLADIPRLLFAEPNPAPIKYWLWRNGLITSPEVRLPLTGITPALAQRIDRERARRQGDGGKSGDAAATG